MLWEYADKIFRIKKVLWWYVIYVAKYHHPKWRNTKWKECTRRTSLSWVINYIIKQTWIDKKEHREVDILKWWVCAESREDYLMDLYK